MNQYKNTFKKLGILLLAFFVVLALSANVKAEGDTSKQPEADSPATTGTPENQPGASAEKQSWSDWALSFWGIVTIIALLLIACVGIWFFFFRKKDEEDEL